jgi:hypothetical protein
VTVTGSSEAYDKELVNIEFVFVASDGGRFPGEG